MKKIIQILHCDEVKVHLPLMRVFLEFSEALKIDSNWEIITVTNINHLTDEGIVLCGNDFQPGTKDCIRNTLSKFTEAIFILWYWRHHISFYDIIERDLIKKSIHTSEEKLKPLPFQFEVFGYYHSIPNYVPLLLRANESLEMIGKNIRNDEMTYCFMGSSYRMDMIPHKYSGIYHRADINGFLDYDSRKDIYLKSIFALGYHGEEPITQKSISQRIFEGLAYGCIVLTNSKYACEYTDDICIYVNCLEDVEKEIEFYMNNADKRKEKQELGYEWFKKGFGTNRDAWKLFFDKIQELKF